MAAMVRAWGRACQGDGRKQLKQQTLFLDIGRKHLRANLRSSRVRAAMLARRQTINRRQT